MSNGATASLQSLPVELLHYIFDHLDIETILLSLRQVCRFFRSVVQTYDRYDLDCRLISKANFRFICRIVSCHNVVSVTITDERTPGQVDLFLSLVQLRQLVRLRSLALIDINESHANVILKHISVNRLRSLTIKVRKYDRRRQKTIGKLLSSVIVRSELSQLNLALEGCRISTIQWPSRCTLRYLTVDGNMTFNTLCTILQCSPNLHTLVMRNSLPTISRNDAVTPSAVISLKQLRSLTLAEMRLTTDQLESLLLCTPALVHLKMIVQINRLDGKQWENFIPSNLPMLERFDIYFYGNETSGSITAHMESVITSFKSPFWLEHKHWPVNCDYGMDGFTMTVYTTPVCRSNVKYITAPRRVSRASTIGNDSSLMDNVDSVSIAMTSALAHEIRQKEAAMVGPMFRRATKLHLDLADDWPFIPLYSLATLVDLTRIVEMEFRNCYPEPPDPDTFSDIISLIQGAPNLSSLVIHQHFAYGFNLSTETICCIIPPHLKHLQVPVDDLYDMEIVLERCGQLSSIQCEIRQSKFSKQIVQWLTANTIDSTYRVQHGFVHVWLGRKKIQSHEFPVNLKRIKLSESPEQ